MSRNFIPILTEHPWSLWIWTSDISGAGTDATVYFQIYGVKGKSDAMKLDNKTDNFEQGQLDKFIVRPEGFLIFFPSNILNGTDGSLSYLVLFLDINWKLYKFCSCDPVE